MSAPNGKNGRIAFRNVRLIDPASGLDTKGGLLAENGRIADIGPRLFNEADPRDPEIIDCHGLALIPGLIDCRVFTGEPGSEHRESLASASEAAAAGGVTTIVTMPNTNPVIDEPSLVDFIRRRAQATAKVRVAPMAALTQRLAGEAMTEIGLLQEAAIASSVSLASLPAEKLAALINAVPVQLTGIASMARAISSAGGVAFDQLDADFMLRRLPGVFAAGEMLDWEAPTGGYLLQACFATGAAAGRGALKWL